MFEVAPISLEIIWNLIVGWNQNRNFLVGFQTGTRQIAWIIYADIALHDEWPIIIIVDTESRRIDKFVRTEFQEQEFLLNFLNLVVMKISPLIGEIDFPCNKLSNFRKIFLLLWKLITWLSSLFVLAKSTDQEEQNIKYFPHFFKFLFKIWYLYNTIDMFTCTIK